MKLRLNYDMWGVNDCWICILSIRCTHGMCNDSVTREFGFSTTSIRVNAVDGESLQKLPTC